MVPNRGFSRALTLEVVKKPSIDQFYKIIMSLFLTESSSSVYLHIIHNKTCLYLGSLRGGKFLGSVINLVFEYFWKILVFFFFWITGKYQKFIKICFRFFFFQDPGFLFTTLSILNKNWVIKNPVKIGGPISECVLKFKNISVKIIKSTLFKILSMKTWKYFFFLIFWVFYIDIGLI